VFAGTSLLSPRWGLERERLSAADAPAGSTGAPPPAPAPLSTGPIVEAHIGYLAGDAREGREAGTAGCEAAERYIEEVLRAARLDAVESQPFEFVAGIRLEEGSTLALNGKAVAGGDFIPLAFSASGKAAARAVFAGYGIAAKDLGHDDYQGVDPKGKIVVVLSGSPDGDNPHGTFAEHSSLRARALAAQARGAAGLVVIAGAGPHGETLPEFRGDRSGHDAGLFVAAVKESASAALGIETAKARKRLAAHEVVSRDLDASIEIEVRLSPERRTTRNVLGWIRARHPEARDELLIIGAHHDHLGRGISGSLAKSAGEIHNGADDNASGVAALLEMARYFAPRASDLKRHLLFIALGAEEWGLLGSKHFKANPLLRLPAAGKAPEAPLKPIAMINLDMVGRLKDGKLLVSGGATSPLWPGLLNRVREEKGHALTLSIDEKEKLFGSSDHVSFYSMNLPVLFFFTGSHAEYHKPSDDLYRPLSDGKLETLVNIEGLVTILGYLIDVVAAVVDLPEPPPFNPNVELTPPSMSFPVVLRLTPDYGAEVDGMRIAGVNPSGPAAKGGLREGDVIVRLGETPVHSVDDYMVALGKGRPGKALAVEVRRGQERVVLEVIPESTRAR
jgi:hypothetical protein